MVCVHVACVMSVVLAHILNLLLYMYMKSVARNAIHTCILVHVVLVSEILSVNLH